MNIFVGPLYTRGSFPRYSSLFESRLFHTVCFMTGQKMTLDIGFNASIFHKSEVNFYSYPRGNNSEDNFKKVTIVLANWKLQMN